MDDIFRIGLIVCAYFSTLREEKRIKHGLTMKKRSRNYHRMPILWLTSQKSALLDQSSHLSLL